MEIEDWFRSPRTWPRGARNSIAPTSNPALLHQFLKSRIASHRRVMRIDAQVRGRDEKF